MQFSPTGRGGGGQHQFNPSLCPSLLQPEGHFPIWKHFCTILPLATQPPSAPQAKNWDPLGHASSGDVRTALINRQPTKKHSLDGERIRTERIRTESIFNPMCSPTSSGPASSGVISPIECAETIAARELIFMRAITRMRRQSATALSILLLEDKRQRDPLRATALSLCICRLRGCPSGCP
jgi:hypothetical protein